VRDLCKVHNLVLSPDGTCVVCRRPATIPFGVSAETEELLSRVVTAALGVCLVLAVGALIYVSQLDEGYTGPVTRVVPAEPMPASSAPKASRTPPRATAVPRSPATATTTPNRLVPSHEANRPTRQVRVVMYSAPWCYVCDRARDFLSADAVELVERDVERDPAAARALAQRNPLQTLPTFEVLGETQVGFSPARLEAAVRSGLAAGPLSKSVEPGPLSAR
jgi:glutaredoxin